MKKLKLKKEVIVDLNNEEMREIYGGNNIRSVYPCNGISYDICGDNSRYCPGTHTCPTPPPTQTCPTVLNGCPTPAPIETTPPPTDDIEYIM